MRVYYFCVTLTLQPYSVKKRSGKVMGTAGPCGCNWVSEVKKWQCSVFAGELSLNGLMNQCLNGKCSCTL